MMAIAVEAALTAYLDRVELNKLVVHMMATPTVVLLWLQCGTFPTGRKG
jgi:hypothetical protein